MVVRTKNVIPGCQSGNYQANSKVFHVEHFFKKTSGSVPRGTLAPEFSEVFHVEHFCGKMACSPP